MFTQYPGGAVLTSIHLPFQDVVAARPREGAARHRLHEPRLLGASRTVSPPRKCFPGKGPEGGFIVVGQILPPVRLISGGLLISKCIMHFANYCRFNSARSFWLVRLIFPLFTKEKWATEWPGPKWAGIKWLMEWPSVIGLIVRVNWAMESIWPRESIWPMTIKPPSDQLLWCDTLGTRAMCHYGQMSL